MLSEVIPGYCHRIAFSIDSEEKKEQEIKLLFRGADSFKKIVVVKDDIVPCHYYDKTTIR